MIAAEHNKKGELCCNPWLTLCKGQFWLDLSGEICFKERYCHSRFSDDVLMKRGDVLSIGHTVSRKHSETTTTKVPGWQASGKWVEPAPLAETTGRSYSDLKYECEHLYSPEIASSIFLLAPKVVIPSSFRS